MERLLAEMGIDADAGMVACFTAYLDAIEEANKRFNLTRIPRDEGFHAHILDALAPVSLGVIPNRARVLDIGTGAGVPGVPLLIARSDIRLCMIDGTKKKIDFVRDTCAALGLEAECLHARAEELAKQPGYSGAFDIITVRAVASVSKLVPLISPLLKRGGTGILYKGPSVAAELAEARSAMGKGQRFTVDPPVAYRVPGREWERFLLFIKST